MGPAPSEQHTGGAQGLSSESPNLFRGSRVVENDRIVIFRALLQTHGIMKVRPPPAEPPDIRTFAIDLVELADFQPRKISPCPEQNCFGEETSTCKKQPSHIAHPMNST